MKLKHLLPGRKYLEQKRQKRGKEQEFRDEFDEFQSKASTDGRHQVRWEDRYPCLEDRTTQTNFDRHYIYHTAWASRILADQQPAKHVDVGSSLFFVTSLSAFVPVDFYDYRPAELNLPGVRSFHGCLSSLPFEDRSVHSLSCMHVVEHVGLGRYGDPIDPTADVVAMKQLQRVVAKGGDLLFVTPVGKPKVCFNAHRVYGYQQIVESFSELDLIQFALVPDDPASGGLLVDAEPAMVADQAYGCGCFWFRRPQ